MAYVSQLDFVETWQSRTTGSIDFVDEWIKSYLVQAEREESRFIAALSDGPEISTFEPTWMSQSPYPRTILGQIADTGGGTYSITFSGKFNRDTLTTDLLQQIVRPNQILMKENSDGTLCQVKVTSASISGLTLVCEAFGNTTISTDTAATTYHLGTVPHSPKYDFSSPTSLPRRLDHTWTQKFTRNVEFTDDERNLTDKVIRNIFQNKVEAALKDLAQEVGWVMINGRPTYDTGTAAYLSGYDTEYPTMAGALWWAYYANTLDTNPLVYVNANDQPLTPQMLKDLAHNLRIERAAKFNKADWEVWGNPSTMRYTDSWESEYIRTTPDRGYVGFEKEGIILEGQKVPFKDDMQWPERIVMLMQPKRIEKGYVNGGSTKRKQISVSGPWYEQWVMYEQRYGLMPEDYMVLGLIYNIRPYGT